MTTDGSTRNDSQSGAGAGAQSTHKAAGQHDGTGRIDGAGVGGPLEPGSLAGGGVGQALPEGDRDLLGKDGGSVVGKDGRPVVLLQPQDYERIDRELAKYPPEGKQSAVMAALTIAQDRIGWVSPAVIDDVARYLKLAPIAVWEVASFYNMYDTKPVGQFKIGVCTCLPCALRDGAKAGEYLKQKLGIEYGETTADGRFTLIETECLGACGDAPVCLVNNKRMESFLDNAGLDALIAELAAQPGRSAADRREND